MNFIINKLVLENTIKTINKNINKENTLKDLFISANSDGTIKITSFGLNSFGIIGDFTAQIEGEIQEPGEIRIDHKQIENILKNHDSLFINVYTNNNNLCFEGDGAKSAIQLENNFMDHGEKYILDNEFLGSLNYKDFKNLVNSTKNCLSKDNTKPVLQYFYVEIKENQIKFTSIDGYKTTTAAATIKGNNKDTSFLAYGNNIKKLTTIKGVDRVEIYKNDKYITFMFNDTYKYITPVGAGEFIQYNKLYKGSGDITLSGNSKQILNTLKTFKETTKNTRNKLVVLDLDIDNNCITIKDFNNTMKASIYINMHSDVFTRYFIGFNVNYLIDIFSTIKTDFTGFLTTNVNPIEIYSNNNKSLLLPVRISQINENSPKYEIQYRRA